MIDTRLRRWLRPLFGRRRDGRRTPELFRPRGTSSRVSRLAARYDADVDAALQRLWPKARIYHDREFTRDRADFLLVVRGRGVMVETKVKSDPGVFRGRRCRRCWIAWSGTAGGWSSYSIKAIRRRPAN